MPPLFDEFELVESAYRHGYQDADIAEMLRRPKMIIRSRRRGVRVYEIFGRNVEGEYLLAAARVVQYDRSRVLRVFHVNRMTDAERRRFLRQVRES